MSENVSFPSSVERVLATLLDDEQRQPYRTAAVEAAARGDDPLEAVALAMARSLAVMREFPDNLPQIDAARAKRRKAETKHAEIRELAQQLRAKNPALSDTSIAEILSRDDHGSARNIRRVLTGK